MNFFRHQEQARRNTLWLVLLFLLATGAVIFVTNLLFKLVVMMAGGTHYSTEHAAVVSVTTLLVILISSFFRQLSLRHGRDVANALKATLLDPGSSDLKERRLLNVVEEMAIASGMPVPDVYVMEDDSINAFAAGYQPSDAVIGITRGAINGLNREQLQGVIAHEFSHIFNGDMRMNMRMTGILYGILFIAEMGRMLLHRMHYRHDRNGTHPGVYGIAFGLIAIGYTGEFFGRLIKAGVSRQREFLADASAVQFTRNASGISGALKVIGYGVGSRVSSSSAVEMSHFFFGPVAFLHKRNLFATHPPLDERIQRIEPGWDGHYLEPERAPLSFSGEAWQYPASGFVGAPLHNEVSQLASEGPDTAAEQTATAAPLKTLTPDEIELAISNAHSARALIFALLMLEADEATARRQQDQIERLCGQPTFIETLRLLNELRRRPADQLTLTERCIPALRRMSVSQYQEMNTALVTMIKMDGRVSLNEWSLYRLILQYLGSHFGTVAPARVHKRSASSIAENASTVMAYVANAGHENDEEREAAYQAGMAEGGFKALQRNPDYHTDVRIKPLNLALRVLTESLPGVREQVLRGLIACARHDQQIHADERAMITTIAAILETPLGLFGDETEALFR